jgi:HK97 family phage major capsid protein
MTLVKYTKKVDLTYEILQDEDSRLMDFLNGYVAAGFAATMNNLVVTEALSGGTAGLTFDSATAIAAAEIPELLYKLSAEYAQGANVAWLMKRATEGYIHSIASSSIFTFNPTPGGSASGQSVNSVLWGLPAYSNDNMGALAASGKSLIVGDWSKTAYRLDPTMTVLRDPYSRAGNGEVILHYYFRADVEVLQAASLQYGSHPSA